MAHYGKELCLGLTDTAGDLINGKPTCCTKVRCKVQDERSAALSLAPDGWTNDYLRLALTAPQLDWLL